MTSGPSRGGGNGAGLTFLALPASDMEAQVEASIRWDLSAMPVGSRGVWSLGAGDVTRVTTVQDLLFSYYASGKLNAEEEGDFALYWFGSAPFDMAEVARRTKALFGYMSGFFGDREACYRIFARRDPFEKSGGGTAAARSFMFGYSEKTYPSVDAMLNLLAHEMTHNWPHMDDEPAGLATWVQRGQRGVLQRGAALARGTDRAGGRAEAAERSRRKVLRQPDARPLQRGAGEALLAGPAHPAGALRQGLLLPGQCGRGHSPFVGRRAFHWTTRCWRF